MNSQISKNHNRLSYQWVKINIHYKQENEWAYAQNVAFKS